MARPLRLGWLFPLAACAGTAPTVTWSEDLAAVQAAATADQLLLVRFTVAGGDRQPAVWTDQRVRVALAPHRTVQLDATGHARRFREIFDTGPAPALAVLDRDGLCLAARLGHGRAVEIVDLLRRAAAGAVAVRQRYAALKELPLRGQRAAQCRAAFALAEAFRAAGHPYAAYRYYTLVTLLAPPGRGGQPEVLAACAQLARIEVERGRPGEAREWLDDLRERAPATAGPPAGVQLTEAILARRERRVTNARAILDQLRQDPGHGEPDRVLLELGRACHDVGRDGEARQSFRALIERFPESAWRGAAERELDHLDGTAGDDHPEHRHREAGR